jgi:leucyl/phenylalanyl-tRNA--protein transferase
VKGVPVFVLTDELVFPDPSLAEPDGLLALGGDLRPERLLLAYAHGIFPWNGEDEPLLWWSPAPRAVLAPGEIVVSRSLAKAIRRRPYRITLDLAFEAVLTGCAETPRPGQDRTWITPGIKAAFTELHRRGLVHSVEAWDGEALVGGLYGLAIGGVFCGESMFARADDASKIAFVALAEQLRRWEFTMIDCQVETPHLRRFGATLIEREEFMRRLAEGVGRPWRIGAWTLDPDLAGRADGGPPARPRRPPVIWKMSPRTGDEAQAAASVAQPAGGAPGAAAGEVLARGTGEARGGAGAAAGEVLARGTGEARGEAGAGEAARRRGEELARGEASAGAAAGEELARGTGEEREARAVTSARGAGEEARGELARGTGEEARGEAGAGGGDARGA